MKIEKIIAKQIQTELNKKGLNTDLQGLAKGNPPVTLVDYQLKWTQKHTSRHTTQHKIEFNKDHATHKTDPPQQPITTPQGTNYEYANPQFPQNLINSILKKQDHLQWWNTQRK